ncbi:virulence factor TspB C-terminal domain-related protein [Stenotrophomonas maltophilia]|uniref:virulence factor TspB C-terminal domain-related protein n=1 Tax=Stenotrophomonas maltophilia TaxID=40324 RepID=UPI0015A62B05|nr:virulence factor TspB C-terminal domain-related protein [Stenotrophomonas maltophilia]
MYKTLLWCVLGVFGIVAWPHNLHAHPVTQCQLSTNPACDQGVAYQALQGMPGAHCSALSPGAYPRDLSIDHDQRGRRYTATFGCLSAKGGNIANDQSHFTVYGAICADRKEYNGAFPGGQYKPKSGSFSCDLGCTVAWRSNSDGTVNGSTKSDRTCTGEKYDSDDECNAAMGGGDGYFYNRQVGVCEPKESNCGNGTMPNSLGQCAPEPCPDGMAQQMDGTCKKKDNECPAGQVRSPDGKCLPGDGQCAKGEVRGPDGTCKKDADNDGKPDPVDDESFSGGDECNAPPSCSGSPIMCGQARIQWRIDCNTRKNRNIAGGSCAAMPVCTGDKCDAMEYSALLMQWRSACALEKMAQGNGNGGENGDTKAIRDALTGTGGAVTTAPDRPSSDVWAPSSGTPVKPDTGGYGWGRTCPQPPSFEVFGNTIQINTAPLCNWLILGSYFVMGLAALASLRIIASRDA